MDINVKKLMEIRERLTKTIKRRSGWGLPQGIKDMQYVMQVIEKHLLTDVVVPVSQRPGPPDDIL